MLIRENEICEMSLALAEPVGHERGDSIERFLGIRPVGHDLDMAAGSRGEQHQSHDRRAVDRDTVPGNRDVSMEALDELDKFRGGAGMQAALVGDFEGPARGGRLSGQWGSLSGQNLACDIDVFAPGLAGLRQSLLHRLILAYPSKLDQHGEVHSSEDLDAAGFHDGDGKIGRCTAEHVGHDDDTVAAVDIGNAGEDIAPALFHVIIRADTDRRELDLGPDDMFDRALEFVCEVSVRNEHDADH